MGWRGLRRGDFRKAVVQLGMGRNTRDLEQGIAFTWLGVNRGDRSYSKRVFTLSINHKLAK